MQVFKARRDILDIKDSCLWLLKYLSRGRREQTKCQKVHKIEEEKNQNIVGLNDCIWNHHGKGIQIMQTYI